jgi:hypothetical protein
MIVLCKYLIVDFGNIVIKYYFHCLKMELSIFDSFFAKFLQYEE